MPNFLQAFVQLQLQLQLFFSTHKLNLRQSMPLRIRRVANPLFPPAARNAKATSTARDPEDSTRLTRLTRRHLATFITLTSSMCLRCLQHSVCHKGVASVCVCHAPRLLATLGLRHAFYPLEQQRQRRRQRHHRAALYANGVFIKVVFILRDIFAASFALFLCFSFFFFWRF